MYKLSPNTIYCTYGLWLFEKDNVVMVKDDATIKRGWINYAMRKAARVIKGRLLTKGLFGIILFKKTGQPPRALLYISISYDKK